MPVIPAIPLIPDPEPSRAVRRAVIAPAQGVVTSRV